MKYTLVNPNFSENYVENLISCRGGDLNKMINVSLNDIAPPTDLDNIEEGAELLFNAIKQSNKKICLIVD